MASLQTVLSCMINQRQYFLVSAMNFLRININFSKDKGMHHEAYIFSLTVATLHKLIKPNQFINL